jgi:outer membrane autotransporter protein
MFGGSLETGYRLRSGSFEATPFAGLQFGTLESEGYEERKTGENPLLGLAYSGRSITSVPTFLGLQLKAETTFESGAKLSAWVRGAWKHEWHTDRSVKASFLTAPGYDFVVQGAQPDKDALRASAGLKLQYDANVALFAGFSGDFARSGQGYMGTAGIQVAW